VAFALAQVHEALDWNNLGNLQVVAVEVAHYRYRNAEIDDGSGVVAEANHAYRKQVRQEAAVAVHAVNEEE